MKPYLQASAALAIALVHGAATAQAAGSSAEAASSPSATAPSGSAPASNGGLAEIVVTAERRASTAQRTPATIEVLRGADLTAHGVSTIDDALTRVSGVFIQQNNKGANVNVRGVGTDLDSAAGDPGVNTNVDGVYIREASAIITGLYDIDRIEVLKGPQGTLYGRNATGGVVNILTADPTIDAFGYHALLSVGNYNLVRSDAALNVPLSDTLAARAAFGSESHKGYYNTGQDDADRLAGRIKLLWKPSDTLRVLVGGSYAHDGGNGLGSILVAQPEGSRRTDDQGVDSHLNQRFLTAFSTIQLDTGPVVITFNPTFSRFMYDSRGYSAGFNNRQRVRENQFTSELRFSSPSSSRIQWVAGAYYYNNRLNNRAVLVNAGIINDQPHLNTDSYAFFGDVTVPIGSQLRLVGGVRYTKDHKTQQDTTVTGGGVTVGPFDGKLDSKAINFRAGVQYDVAPTAMLYATYATGYKAGGFTPDEPGFNTFKPERLKSIEGGLKSRFLHGRLQLNLGGFYYRYTNYQVSALGFAHYGGLSALVYNSQGKTQVYGAEVQLSYRPTRDDEFSFSLSPLHSQFGKFFIPATVAQTPGGPVVISPAIDVTGKSVPSAPAISGTASYEHDWRLASGGRVNARVGTYFSSKYWSEFSHAPFSQRPGYTKTDATLTYFGKDDRWSIGAFVKNIENSWIVTLKANTAVGDYFLAPPRTFGLIATMRR